MENNSPNILIIGPRGIFGCEGGIEKFTDAFIPRALPYSKINVLTINNTDMALPPGLSVTPVPRTKRFKTDKAMYLIYALYEHFRKRYDHIFIFGTNFAVLIPLLKVFFWKKTKIHLRSGSIDHVLPKWGSLTKKILIITERFARYADTVIAVAPSIQKHLNSLGISAILIRNGVDRINLSLIQNQRQPQTILAVGRITVQKNYKTLVRAIQNLGQDAPMLTIIGGADLSDEAYRLKKIIKSEDKIVFTGALHRSEVLAHLSQQSLYINCSIHEGMSNAVLEAIQQGIPILLSDIDANRDLMLPEHIYFKPDDIRSLSVKIVHALKDPKQYTIDPLIFEDWDVTINKYLECTGVIRTLPLEA